MGGQQVILMPSVLSINTSNAATKMRAKTAGSPCGRPPSGQMAGRWATGPACRRLFPYGVGSVIKRHNISRPNRRSQLRRRHNYLGSGTHQA